MAYEILVFLKVLNGKAIWRLGLGGQRLLNDESDGRIILRVRLAIEKSACVSHYVEKKKQSKQSSRSKAGETSRRNKREMMHQRKEAFLPEGSCAYIKPVVL